jgi:hypothetical protein
VLLAEALAEGACPRLRELLLVGVGIGNEGHQALARAMSVGGLPRLTRLDLRGRRYGWTGPEGPAWWVEYG